MKKVSDIASRATNEAAFRAQSQTERQMAEKRRRQEALGHARSLFSLLTAEHFDEHGEEIAPLVDLGEGPFPRLAAKIGNYADPLMNPMLIRRAVISYRDGRYVSGHRSKVLIGDHIRALPLGADPEGDRIYLAAHGYLGHTIPRNNFDRATVRPAGERDTAEAITLTEWCSGDTSSSIPIVDFGPREHILYPNDPLDFEYRLETLLGRLGIAEPK